MCRFAKLLCSPIQEGIVPLVRAICNTNTANNAESSRTRANFVGVVAEREPEGGRGGGRRRKREEAKSKAKGHRSRIKRHALLRQNQRVLGSSYAIVAHTRACVLSSPLSREAIISGAPSGSVRGRRWRACLRPLQPRPLLRPSIAVAPRWSLLLPRVPMWGADMRRCACLLHTHSAS